MRKFTLDAWDRHIANIQIEGYGQGLVRLLTILYGICFLVSILNVIL